MPPSVSDAQAIKRRWTTEEDKLLRDAVERNGAHNWAHIASHLPNRNEKQARERWMNQLRPGVSKAEWTAAEDMQIVHAHAQLGSSWAEIARLLPGRSDQMVKNRYNNHLRKRLFVPSLGGVSCTAGDVRQCFACGSQLDAATSGTLPLLGGTTPATAPLLPDGVDSSPTRIFSAFEHPPTPVTEETLRLAAAWASPPSPHQLAVMTPEQPHSSLRQPRACVSGVPILAPLSPPTGNRSALIVQVHSAAAPPPAAPTGAFNCASPAEHTHDQASSQIAHCFSLSAMFTQAAPLELCGTLAG